MKKRMLFSATILMMNVASAATLNCWKTDFKSVKTPFMTASIEAEGLRDIKFLYRNSGLTAPAGIVRGEPIATNHSPYRGNVRYFVNGAGDLILPANLTNENLVAVEAQGLGVYKNENGVLISSWGDDEAGNHVSYRLSCRSHE